MRHALSLLALTTGLSAFAQSWFPSGATWTYNYADQLFTGYVSHVITGDTLLDGRTCQVMGRTRTYGLGGQVYIAQLAPYCVLDSAGVVWIHVPNEGLDTLYFMGASPGDGWMLAAMPEPCDTSAYLEVTDTGHVVLDGAALRWLAVSMQFPGTLLPTLQDTIVERLGTLLGYLSPQNWCLSTLDGSEGGLLRCYSDGELSFTSYLVEQCELNLGMEGNGDQAAVSLFPNPGTSGFALDGPQRLVSMRVWDPTGRSVRLEPDVLRSSRVVTRDWAPGCYCVDVMFTDGSRSFLRWIKQ